jgi:hypothetical protein
MTLNVIPSELSAVAYAYRVRPEEMLTIRAESSQTRGRILYRRAPAGIGRIGQNADQRVLREWTGRPSAAAIVSEPCMRRLVMQVRGIEQRNQDVYVEQSDHARLRFVPELVDSLKCDEPRPSLLGQDRHAVALARRTISRRQCATGQLRKHTSRGRSASCRELLGALQDVVINIQCGAHLSIITHQSSGVKAVRPRNV